MNVLDQADFFCDDVIEDPVFLKEQIITYIGNKRALLPLIGSGVTEVKRRTGKPRLSTLDLFAGTGIVARFLKKHSYRLVVNDLELYSYIVNRCYLTNVNCALEKEVREAIGEVNNALDKTNLVDGFITRLYSPIDDKNIKPGERVFYTRRNARYIDTARQLISGYGPEIQPYLIAPLLSKASVHANTSGVFKGFYKSKDGIGQFGGTGRDALQRILADIRLVAPVFSRFDSDVTVSQENANVYAHQLREEFDLAYLDPPYNQHPYGSNYFMLNLIATYREPTEISAVSGIPVNWNRSRYNQRANAATELFEVINACPAKFVMISYNSEGFITKDEFVDGLKKLGRLTQLETTYNAFRGSRNLADRPTHVTEYLYLLEKN